MIDLKWGLVLPPDILVRYLEGKSCNIISFFKAPFLATPSASNTPPDTLPEGILEAFKTAETLRRSLVTLSFSLPLHCLIIYYILWIPLLLLVGKCFKSGNYYNFQQVDRRQKLVLQAEESGQEGRSTGKVEPDSPGWSGFKKKLSLKSVSESFTLKST